MSAERQTEGRHGAPTYCSLHRYVRGRQCRECCAWSLRPDSPFSTDRDLIDMLRETAENFFVPDAAALARKVADQIEEQVGARVTKPAEPMGLGAVVEDAEGRRFIRLDGNLAPWYQLGVRYDARPWRHFKDIAAVKVLSEGVTQ